MATAATEDPVPGSRPRKSSTPPWNANSAFAPTGHDAAATLKSAREAAARAGSRQELLRRISLVDRPKEAALPVPPPWESYPGVHASGKVISALFCLPYSITFKSSAEWELGSRRGTSALFDSLAYLSSRDSPWQHTVVGWTGEIKGPAADSYATDNLVNGFRTTKAPDQPGAKAGSSRTTNSGDVHVNKEDRQRLEKLLDSESKGGVVPVWLLDDMDDDAETAILRDQRRWRRYGEHELYTLFHYKQHEPTDGRAERIWWADYYRMNVLFADRIMEIYEPGDIIWVHDYHLMLLPSILRQRLQDAYIGFFLHIPFPSSEYIRCLSRRKEVLGGMLGANLIGFQSFGYSRHFVSCCKRILRFESTPAGVDAYGNHVAVDVFPIGIHATRTQRAAFEDPLVEEKVQQMKKQFEGKKLLVGRDRLDTVRGVAQKLQAFEIFLQRYPEWREKVVLIQVTSPTSVKEEKEDASNRISNKISDLVSRINSTFGNLSYSPIQHYPQYISKAEYFSLLRVADVGLITSVRDGMNTTSLEYVVCQKDHHGPLILSEFSGTAGNLSHAIHINPWNLGNVAESINRALLMPDEERRDQHDKLYQHVTTNTVQAWTDKLLRRLLTSISSFGQSVATPTLDKTALLLQFRASKSRLFMFDYDGTLTPIVRDPQSAIPSDRVVRTLKMLASDPRNSVWIISGRDQAFLEEWLGHIPELGLSAEHGSFVRHPLHDDWENVTEKVDMSWQEDVMAVFQRYTEKTQGSFIEQKRVALTWHYRRADPELGRFQAAQCREELENTVAKRFEIEVMAGKANLEVRPNFVNKGAIAKRLVREASATMRQDGAGSGVEPEPSPTDEENPELDFVLCLGDDFTDEDMFRALNESNLPRECVFTCTVGASSKQTLADYHLLEPGEVVSVISMLNGYTDDSNVGAVAIVDGAVPESRL